MDKNLDEKLENVITWLGLELKRHPITYQIKMVHVIAYSRNRPVAICKIIEGQEVHPLQDYVFVKGLFLEMVRQLKSFGDVSAMENQNTDSLLGFILTKLELTDEQS